MQVPRTNKLGIAPSPFPNKRSDSSLVFVFIRWSQWEVSFEPHLIIVITELVRIHKGLDT